ncbi:MAG: DUF4340 domain-containing protein [Alphaproteobacteria bacterium]|nr:DUF4340 domain-containing protein [Alphaproteobacteria bacterium]
MRTRTLFVVIVVMIFVAGAAYYAVKHRNDESTVHFETGRFYPDLKDKLNDIDAIEIIAPDVNIKLTRKNDLWVVPDKFNYPADFKNIKRNLTALSELVKAEAKTRKKDYFPNLGVDEIKKDAKGLKFIASVGANHLVDLYIGTHVPGIQDGYFVRSEGDDQVWLARGNIKINPDLKEWLQSDIMSVDKNRMASMHFTPSEGEEFNIWRDDAKKTSFQMQPVPEGRKIKSPYTVDMIAKGLTDLSFADVLPKDRVNFQEKPIVTYKTFDGLYVEIFLGKAHKKEDDAEIEAKSSKDFLNKAPGGKAESNEWVFFKASFDTQQHDKFKDTHKGNKEGVEEEVKKVNTKLSPWAYHLPSYKLEILKRNLDSMLEPVKKEGGEARPKK